MAIALFVLGACCAAAARFLLLRANPGVRVPIWWGQPPITPRESMVLNLLALGSAILGALNLDAHIGLPVRLVLIVAALFLPSALVHLSTRLLQGKRNDDDRESARRDQ